MSVRVRPGITFNQCEIYSVVIPPVYVVGFYRYARSRRGVFVARENYFGRQHAAIRRGVHENVLCGMPQRC